MNGNWLRLTPAELAHAAEDLPWAQDHAWAAYEAGSPRWLCTEKTWHALSYLLGRHGLGISIVFGEESFREEPEASEETDDEEYGDEEYGDEDDWGYGPPRYLTPAQVAAAAAAIATLTEADLVRGVDPGELARANVYPEIWNDPRELAWAVHYLPEAREFFAAAAKDGDAILCWLD
ncbi:DUF1877 family protein [Paractinoplanes durhamensis]|uniref:DUF1877 family protein n=1 Tax=Paractinoplanes durhamensis TaxID=113563 RepID=A0ABQ3YVZ1_9ACTN|nr:DUF1877 family protein [Actinoplanes durhamensis]GIE01738.1 hypothetical protein Adu01nite_30880 [Actinoplanes durhamensis]